MLKYRPLHIARLGAVICSLLTFLGLFQTSQAQPEPSQVCMSKEAINLQKTFAKVFTKPNEWPSVDRDRMVFAFRDLKKSGLFLYGKNLKIPSQEAEKLNLKILKCDLEGFYILQSDFAIGEGPIQDFSHRLFKVVDSNFFISMSYFDGAPKGFDIEAYLVTYAMHESFHLQTVGQAGTQKTDTTKVSASIFASETFKMLAPHDIATVSTSECLRPGSPFYLALQKDFSLIRNLGFIWKLKSVDARTAQAIQAIIANRLSLRGTQFDSCWHSFRDRERIEGTATYFPVASGVLVTDSVFAANPLDLNNPKTLEQSNTGPWYLTGARLCKLADLLDPTKKWQELVQRGLSPDLVIAKLMGAE